MQMKRIPPLLPLLVTLSFFTIYAERLNIPKFLRDHLLPIRA
jgi:hypothetical protein